MEFGIVKWSMESIKKKKKNGRNTKLRKNQNA